MKQVLWWGVLVVVSSWWLFLCCCGIFAKRRKGLSLWTGYVFSMPLCALGLGLAIAYPWVAVDFRSSIAIPVSAMMLGALGLSLNADLFSAGTDLIVGRVWGKSKGTREIAQRQREGLSGVTVTLVRTAVVCMFIMLVLIVGLLYAM